MNNCSSLTMQWKIHSQFGQEKLITKDVVRLLSLNHIESSRIEEVATAISEACLNAIEHGNKLEQHRVVEVTMEMHENGCTFRIYDDGDGFNDLHPSRAPLDTISNDIPRGWGLLIMNAFANQLRNGYVRSRFFVEMFFVM